MERVRGARGLLLPAGVIQPFFLRFAPDDWHVMAFIEGHPAYEAVEAMVRERPDGGYVIRAIITRHDGSQIDHLNDEALAAASRGALREVVARDIDFSLDLAGPQPRARLAFVSGEDEPVVLALTALGPPDPANAGLTDPGGHSADSSLPLMWRGASTLATEAWAEIGGRRYEAPVRRLSSGLAAREGYLTRDHHMGVIRAGEVRLRPLSAPDAPAPGAEWLFDGGGRTVAYRITGETPDGALTIDRVGGPSETLIARPLGERLELLEVAVPRAGGLALRLEDGRFEIAIGARPLVAGRASAGPGLIALDPETPAWAAARPVRVAIGKAEGATTFTTTIG